jgi:predicted O-methyltransferase YrrM
VEVAVTQDQWSAVDRYFADLLIATDPGLDDALGAAARAGMPAINVAPNQGRLLNLLARASGARAILEVGTLAGYSTIWLARSLAAGGRVVSLELDPRHAEVARRNLARAGVEGVVEILVGPALESLSKLVAEGRGPFDLVFIDADKENNAAYFGWALRLTRPGSVIVVDNVVRGGSVVDGTTDEPGVVGTRRLAEAMARAPVDATVIQTVGTKGWDGLAIAVVK